MWILSTWKWNSRGGLAIIVWTGGRRASRRDWAEIEKGLARPSCQRSGWRDRRAGLALRQGMQFRKTALCWNRFAKQPRLHLQSEWEHRFVFNYLWTISVRLPSAHPRFSVSFRPQLWLLHRSLPIKLSVFPNSERPWGLRWWRVCLQCGRPRFDSLGREDPLEEKMATHSSTLASGIPWTEGPVGLQSVGSHGFPNSGCGFWPA